MCRLLVERRRNGNAARWTRGGTAGPHLPRPAMDRVENVASRLQYPGLSINPFVNARKYFHVFKCNVDANGCRTPIDSIIKKNAAVSNLFQSMEAPFWVNIFR